MARQKASIPANGKPHKRTRAGHTPARAQPPTAPDGATSRNGAAHTDPRDPAHPVGPCPLTT